jgi:hypothetical protein
MAVHIAIGAQKFMRKSRGYFVFLQSAGAPEDRRTPRRFAYFRNHRVARSVLDCGPDASGPLFPEPYQTVSMLIGTAISATTSPLDFTQAGSTQKSDCDKKNIVILAGPDEE